jgi:hypothetical protein
MTLGQQLDQRRQLDMTTRLKDYGPERCLVWENIAYICEEATHRPLKDEWRGRWREIGYRRPSKFKEVKAVNRSIVMAPNLLRTNEPEQPGTGQIGRLVRGHINADGSVGGTGDRPSSGNNDSPAGTTTDIAAGQTTGAIVPNRPPSELSIFAGDRLLVTDPITGATETITARFDYDLGVPTDPTDPNARPVYTEEGEVVFLSQSGTDLATEDFTPQFDLAAGSSLSFDPGYQLRLLARLRRATLPAVITGFYDPLTVGYKDWFWRPGPQLDDHIRAVYFQFGTDEGGGAKVNLKYFDATGYRYTVATYEGGGLGGVVPCAAIITPGYYRVEVETITDPAPRGLQLLIDITKILRE